MQRAPILKADRGPLLDLFPYSAKEWEALGAFDYISSCCLAWIEYLSDNDQYLLDKGATLLTKQVQHSFPHWIYCSDCLKALKTYTDITPMGTPLKA